MLAALSRATAGKRRFSTYNCVFVCFLPLDSAVTCFACWNSGFSGATQRAILSNRNDETEPELTYDQGDEHTVRDR